MSERSCWNCGRMFPSVILWRRTCPECVPHYAPGAETMFARFAQNQQQRDAEERAAEVTFVDPERS